LRIGRRDINWWLWDNGGHLRERDRHGSAIVMKNSIRRCAIQQKIIWERNVHDGTRQQHFCGRIKAFHLSPGRALLLHWEIVIANKGAEQTTVIFDVMVDRTRETIGVNVVAVGFAVSLLQGLDTGSAFNVDECQTMIPSIV
jgi:hypothetical protein